MVADDAKIDQITGQVLSSAGWDAIRGFKLTREPIEMGRLAKAGVDTRAWEIGITVDPNFEDKQVQNMASAGIDGRVKDPVEALVTFLVTHEVGHWKYCPADKAYAEQILHEVVSGMQRGGLEEEQAKDMGPYLSNMFADTILDTVNSMKNKTYADGMALGNLHEAYATNGYYPDYFAIFVDIRMKIGLDAGHFGRDLAKKYGQDYDEISSVANNMIRQLIGDDKLADKVIEGKLSDAEKEKVIDALTDKTRWGDMSLEYARRIAKYMKDKNDEVKNGELSDLMKDAADAMNKQGQGSGGSPGSQQKKQQGDGEGQEKEGEGGDKNKEKDGNGKDKAGKDKEGKDKGAGDKEDKDSSLKKWLKDKMGGDKEKQPTPSQGGGGAGRGFGIGRGKREQEDEYKPFDEVYWANAKEIVIRLKGSDMGPESKSEGEAFPLFWMSRRPVVEGEPLNKIDYFRTRFMSGGMTLYKKKDPFLMPMKMGQKQPPPHAPSDTLFINDVSGSMNWSGEPMDGSPYDMSLRSIYSVMKYIETQGSERDVQYGLIQFSGSTNWSGWKPHRDMYDMRRQLFTGYEGGGTELNTDIVRQALSQNPNRRMIVFMVTDGQIANWQETADLFKDVTSKGNTVVLFQMGYDTEFSQAMRSEGAQVIPIRDPQDIIKISVDIAEKRGSYNQDADLLTARRDQEVVTVKPRRFKLRG